MMLDNVRSVRWPSCLNLAEIDEIRGYQPAISLNVKGDLAGPLEITIFLRWSEFLLWPIIVKLFATPQFKGPPGPPDQGYSDIMQSNNRKLFELQTSVPSPRLGGSGGNRKRPGDGGTGTAVITRTKPQTKRPNLYRVLLLNDDYTPMEFVVQVLERFFGKDREDATRIMLHVHQHGVGECGIYTYEVAETKVTQVMDFSRKHQHPLQCVMEKK